MNDNINLWFAKDENNKIITIDKANKNNKYTCPICGGEVIPKALNSDMVSPHFAHIDRESCEGESIIHWWTKNNLLKSGDVFSVFTNEEKQYLCKEIVVEKEYETPYGKYKPDVTIECYNGEIIFLEVGFTNIKKKVNYIDRWTYLNKPVIEFNIRNIYDTDSLEIKLNNEFQAVYYDGVKIYKNDKSYETFKRNIKNIDNYEQQINDLEWFIDDIYEYKITKNEDKLDGIINEIKYIEESYTYEHALFVEKLLKTKCNSVLKSVIARKDEYFKNKIDGMLSEIGYNYDCKIESFSESRLIWDKLYGGVSCTVKVILKTGCCLKDDIKHIVGLINSKYKNIHTIKYDEEIGMYVERKFYLGGAKDLKNISDSFNKEIIDNIMDVINYNSDIYMNYKKGLYVKDDGYIFNYIDQIIKDATELKYNFLDSCHDEDKVNVKELVLKNINESNLNTRIIKNIEYIDFNEENNKKVIEKIEAQLKNIIDDINRKNKICKEIDEIFNYNVHVVFKSGYDFKFKDHKVLVNMDGVVYYEDLPILNLGYDYEENIQESINTLKDFLEQKTNITPYSQKQIGDLNKLKKIYKNTNKKFIVTLEKNKYILRDNFKLIAEIESDKVWKEIIDTLSDKVREYLYN